MFSLADSERFITNLFQYFFIAWGHMKRFTSVEGVHKLHKNNNLNLPDFSENLESTLQTGKSLQVDGTNVVRVPFGIRQPIKQRPARSNNWITLVLPLNPLGTPTPPPQAA